MRYFVFAHLFMFSIVLATNAPAVELKACKENAPVPPKLVWLRSNQGKCAELKLEVAEQSFSIKNMIADLGGHPHTPIPFANIDNSALKDVTTIMDATFQKSDEDLREQLESLRKSGTTGQFNLIQFIRNASFLDIPRVLHAALDIFAKKVFVEDLSKLRTWNLKAYESYKKGVLQALPLELQHVMIQRYLGSPSPINVATLASTKDEFWAVAFSQDGKKILTGGSTQAVNKEPWTSTVNVYDADIIRFKDKPLATLKFNGSVRGVAMSPDQKVIATILKDDNRVMLWDASPGIFSKLRGNTPFANLKLGNLNLYGDAFRKVVFSPDGRFILTAGGLVGNTSAHLWDASVKGNNSHPIAEFKNDGTVYNVAFSNDGKHILTSGERNITRLWDASGTGDNVKPLATIQGAGSPASPIVVFNSDGTLFLTQSWAPKAWSINVWSIDVRGDKPQPLETLKTGHDLKTAVFKQDGSILTASTFSTLALWAKESSDHHKEAAVWHIPEHLTLAFAPDGKGFVMGRNGQVDVYALFNTNEISLATAQAMQYAYRNGLRLTDLPQHLQDEVNKAYFSQK